MAVQKNTAPPVEGAMFGDLGFYGGGSFLIPEGSYIAKNHEVMNWAHQKAKDPKPKLGVMITFKSRTDPDAAEIDQFYSMGTSAHLSWAPNPETGKGVVPIAGGPGTSLPTSSNWGVYISNLYQSGLEQGVFTNDISVLDGVWVQIAHIPEPEERKGFASKTGEAAPQQRTTPNKIAVVSLIEEDGKPWEGTGGDVAPAAPAKAAPKTAVKAGPVAVKTAPKAAAKSAPAPEPAESDDDALKSAAVSGLGEVLASTPPTMTRLKLRTELFKNLSKADADTAKGVIDTFFANDDALNSILGDVGYQVQGSNIVLV